MTVAPDSLAPPSFHHLTVNAGGVGIRFGFLYRINTDLTVTVFRG